MRIINKIICFMLIISIITPQANAFSLDIFTKNQKTSICEPTTELTEVISKYDGIELSNKICSFSEENGYDKANMIITDKKNGCEYQYTMTIDNTKHMTISHGTSEDAEFTIYSSYNNIFYADRAYTARNPIRILRATLRTTISPYTTYAKIIQFLATYL